MPHGIVKPVNQIVVNGNPMKRNYIVGATATLAKLIPGCIVIYDTADNAVMQAGAKADGVLGVVDIQPGWKMTDYPAAAGDPITIIISECDLMVKLASGNSVVPGNAIVTAANGEAGKQAVGAMGGQGQVIGYALQTANGVTCVIHFNPHPEAAAASG